MKRVSAVITLQGSFNRADPLSHCLTPTCPIKVTKCMQMIAEVIFNRGQQSEMRGRQNKKFSQIKRQLSSSSSSDMERDCQDLPWCYLTSRVISRYKCQGDHQVPFITDLPVNFLSSTSKQWSSPSPDYDRPPTRRERDRKKEKKGSQRQT